MNKSFPKNHGQLKLNHKTQLTDQNRITSLLILSIKKYIPHILSPSFSSFIHFYSINLSIKQH